MDIQDTIDAYVKGQLTGAERASFEKKIESDPALAESVAQARFDLEAANLLLRDELREWMQHWKEDDPLVSPPQPSESPHAVRRRFYWFVAAIAVIAALAAFWFLFQKQTPPSTPSLNTQTTPEQVEEKETGQQKIDTNREINNPASKTQSKPGSLKDGGTDPEKTKEKNTPPKDYPQPIALARQNFRNLPARSFTRGDGLAGSQKQHALNEAAGALADSNYIRAIELAKTVPVSDERYADAQVLLGQVYFQQKQYERAETAIRAALATEKIDPDQAQWNLLMSLLAQYPAKRTDFEALLQQIAQDKGHVFYNLANKLKLSIR